MKRRTFRRVFMSLVTALVLVPVLGGVFCHCAHAEVSNQARIESPVCRGCCPESVTAPDPHAVLTQSPALISRPAGNFKIESLSARTNSSSAQILHDGARGLFGETPPASFIASNPLYLLNLVLRF